jgi:hypothetical protein
MHNVMNEMENAVHDLKYAREKLNEKHMGNLTHVEREMEDMCNFVSESGRINISRLNSARESKKNLNKDESNGNILEKTTPRG